jgi:pimeloyl-ACP methyl ester carboxylesterase
VVLLHGWPSDVHDWDGVVPLLTTHGFRSFVPWLRGFGPTSFLNPSTPRSDNRQRWSDHADFMDALGIPRRYSLDTTGVDVRPRGWLARAGVGLVSIPVQHPA